MKKENLFDLFVIISVVLLHIIALVIGTSGTKPKLEIGVPAMEIVNLGDLNVGQAQKTSDPEVKKVEEIPKPKVKPKLQPKPKPIKDKIIAHKNPNKPADMQVKEDIKPQEKSVEKQATTESNQKNQANSSAGANQSKQGGSQAGSGDAVIAATHLGGHLNNPKPPYPEISLDKKEQGVVRFRVKVEANGLPSDVKIIKSSGFPRLDNSALRTVKSKYKFIPATRAGVPFSTSYEFNIVFNIKN